MKKVRKKGSATKGRSVKNKFVLTVGDEGAILAHYDKGKLENRIFVESPHATEVSLIKKLFDTYPKVPVYMLVDVVEQNYTQKALPPVSSVALKGQVKRRMAKDLHAKDFNNYIQLGRQKEGRKDWDFLFVSLANTEPFSQWFELIMEQENEFAGVYLLPVESQAFLKSISKFSSSGEKTEWEILVLHNKVGGFRIVAVKDEKIIFTRLAQQLIGNNIPDVIVGNLEQEISNTIEYLKRLGFKSEAESKITIIAGGDILQRVEKESLGFFVVDVYTPYQVAEKLGVAHSLDEADKFADIVLTTYFAANSKHVLKFHSPLTQKLDALNILSKIVYVLGGLAFVGLLGLMLMQYKGYKEISDRTKKVEIALKKSEHNANEIQQKYEELPSDVDKMVDILLLSKNFPKAKELVLQVISEVSAEFSGDKRINDINIKFSDPETGTVSAKTNEYNVYAERGYYGQDADFKLYDAKPVQKNREIPKNKEFDYKFEMTLEYKQDFVEKDLDLVKEIAKKFLKDLKTQFPDYEFSYSKEPKAPDFEQKNEVVTDVSSVSEEVISLDSAIKVTGVISEKKKANN